MTVDTRNKILSIVFAIIIVVLAIVLVRSIVIPYQKVEKRQAMTEHVRTRMLHIRDALISYERQMGKFPPNKGGLDSLVTFLRTDSVMKTKVDSLFYSEEYGVVKDSIIYSPRPPHKKFKYAKTDTLIREIYVLKDPGSKAQIGSLTNTTLINTPNW